MVGYFYPKVQKQSFVFVFYILSYQKKSPLSSSEHSYCRTGVIWRFLLSMVLIFYYSHVRKVIHSVQLLTAKLTTSCYRSSVVYTTQHCKVAFSLNLASVGLTVKKSVSEDKRAWSPTISRRSESESRAAIRTPGGLTASFRAVSPKGAIPLPSFSQ